MHDLDLAQAVLAKIRAFDGRYQAGAYVFVLEALEYAQARLPVRRHISGAELAWACRDLALERFGLMARTVLEHWGVVETEDFGRLVFTLVDAGFLAKEPTDRLADFERVYDFGAAFDAGYGWSGVGRER